MNLVKMAVADLSHQRKPLAIVLDADETVVDNTKLMGESIANGNGRFDAPWWRQAVHQGKSQAMPGAVEFFKWKFINKVLKYSTFQTVTPQ